MNIGGLFKSLINPATLMQLAMGPAGWASIAAKMVLTAVAKEVIMQIGQKLGLPPAVISMAQEAFSAATGSAGGPDTGRAALDQLGRAFNFSPAQMGQASRAVDTARDGMRAILEGQMRRAGSSTEDAEGDEGGSVLMKIARALGKIMDDKMNLMAKKGVELGNLGENGALKKDGSFNAEGQSKYGKVTGEMQALGQELSIVSQALANTLKSIGEASSTIARKG